jgi:hypothetical protein
MNKKSGIELKGMRRLRYMGNIMVCLVVITYHEELPR